jgi:hypothetical protein
MFCSGKQRRALRERSGSKESKPVMGECLLHPTLITLHPPNTAPNRPAEGKSMSRPTPFPRVPNQMPMPTLMPMPNGRASRRPNQGVEKGQRSNSNLAKDRREDSPIPLLPCNS